MPTEAKKEKISRVRDYFERADSFFFTHYQGLNVADLTELRAKLRESDSRLVIEKNTLVRVAARELKLEGIEDKLTGPTAIAFVFGDPVAPAKALYESYKKRELPVVTAVSLKGELMDGSRIKDLADLPSRDELLAQVMGAIEAPISELISVTESVTQELIGTLDALAEQAPAKAA
ncbi:MAG: 50S ribosomal protein L10 [Candidatus Zixiibacteriota bacterium]